jgi:putative endonuclease
MRNQSGKLGEDFAASYLQQNRCRVDARNYHSRYGEIDVIASNSRFLIFLEVKTRAAAAMVSPLEAVTLSKQRKIIRTAQSYLLRYPTNLQPRFDVMGITTDATGTVIQHFTYLKNAFSVK